MTALPGWEWPVELAAVTPRGEPLVLRPLLNRDEAQFQHVRHVNAAWLTPWDATNPRPGEAISFRTMVRRQAGEAKAGRTLPLIITAQDRIVGQITASGITGGALWSASVGYWVVESVAGRGIMPTALAAVADHLMGTCGLHRIEVNIRPENGPSLAVVRKLGFREEGVRRAFLHINGAWRDHRSFAVTTEDLAGETLLSRCHHAYLESHARHTDADAASGT
ncbi:GNAT family N-acetyltransferase [Kribbia dieselivorans]|uniref:GNAT family N-acetyltransferase n=1 Tax=Kribbia dieselivorans TaxID=331526 RepID=UPI0008397DD7|nr:GNAT family protein [Kribbia dieselivorans]